MKTKLWILPVALAFGACNVASFGGRTGKRGGGAVDPNSGNQNVGGPVIDVSGQDVNKDAKPDSPKPGTGPGDLKLLELGCDDSQGAEIIVGTITDPNTYVPPQEVTEPTTTEPTDDEHRGDEPWPDFDMEAGLLLGDDTTYTNQSPTLDKDGKPVDGHKVDKNGKPLPKHPPKKTPEAAKVVTSVKGKFCPKVQSKRTILFLVDYSGSMGAHADVYGGPKSPGNDPQINGTCGRLQAAQAVLDKTLSGKLPTDDIQIGMVPFAGGIVTNKVIPLMDAASFRSLVSKDTFCQYIVQDLHFGLDPVNPGALDGTLMGVSAATNYKAAFTAAESLLGHVYGHKDIYFLSDGEPTVPGDGAKATDESVSASIEAGRSLRHHVDNLTFSGVLLENRSLGAAAMDILAQVAGSPERVRLASAAGDLAAEITKFPDAVIDVHSGRASLAVHPYPLADLGLKYLQEDPAVPGQWIYETNAFVLLGKPGMEVVNTVEVVARGLDGSTYKATMRIRYRQ